MNKLYKNKITYVGLSGTPTGKLSEALDAFVFILTLALLLSFLVVIYILIF